jgi:hypothetical protein
VKEDISSTTSVTFHASVVFMHPWLKCNGPLGPRLVTASIISPVLLAATLSLSPSKQNDPFIHCQ